MSKTTTGKHRLLVLVADDDPPIASLVAAVIEDMGYEALIARNGRHALDLARASWPSLVVTDMMMPELSGDDFIRALRAEATASGKDRVPMILMTAAASLQRARDVSPDALLSKPFDLDALEALIIRLLPIEQCH